MNHAPPHASLASGLTRTGSGLSAAHVALIKMLAEVAVEDFLRENEETDAPADDRREVAR